MERTIITIDRETSKVLNVRKEKTDKKADINLFCKFLADSYIKHLQEIKEEKS
ncbi:hypothetical protein J2Z35_001229 [Acetoanaerobium pronyense]|uniref:Transposase n=1 Tax=Acetoanaerobium pronyense TaxID=1482736 RepID=A0ABS4KJC6_9FIRM|nr:hypothetical protein [Acetoanaerobium pronyense]MBP2027435.1 hypothetical protein [Acetoanaerobium pronyense]